MLLTRTSRTRTKVLPWPDGRYDEHWNGVDQTELNSTFSAFCGGGFDYCADSHGRPVVPSALTLIHADRSRYVPVNGTVTSGANHATAKNYIPSYLRGTDVGSVSDPSFPGAASLMTTLLARSNPSRPDISPLDLLQDLKDIPKQLKDVGRLIKSPKRLLNSKEIANQYLGAKFGWLPLIKDVQDLLDIGKHIHRRNDELSRLYTSNGLKRRLNLGEWTATATSNKTIQSHLGLTINTVESIHTIRRCWGVVRWKPTISPRFYPSDAERLKQAKRISLGLTTEGLYQGAWDLLPWTWIVDWFTNVSEFAQTNSNTVPASPSERSVMTETFTEIDYKVTGITSGYTGGSGVLLRHSKERYVGAGSISVRLPYIGADRLSILGALFVQRFKR